MRWKIFGAIIVLAISFASLHPANAVFNQDPGWWGEGGGGPCQVSNCQTTCLFRVECCCWYQCPSGGQWVCKSGYCANTSHSCP
jgi:hypothetical protein